MQAVEFSKCITPLHGAIQCIRHVNHGIIVTCSWLPAAFVPHVTLMFLEEDYGPYGFGPGAGVSSWPDLTERLKKVGAYEKYLEWREGDGHKM